MLYRFNLFDRFGLISLDNILAIDPLFIEKLDVSEKEANSELRKADTLTNKATEMLAEGNEIRNTGKRKLAAILKFRRFAGG